LLVVEAVVSTACDELRELRFETVEILFGRFNNEWSEWDEGHRRVRAGLASAARVAASELGNERVSNDLICA
jgi:hypothetical protein